MSKIHLIKMVAALKNRPINANTIKPIAKLSCSDVSEKILVLIALTSTTAKLQNTSAATLNIFGL